MALDELSLTFLRKYVEKLSQEYMDQVNFCPA